jgi:Zn-dependent M28 family amino/carboxypeptidase
VGRACSKNEQTCQPSGEKNFEETFMSTSIPRSASLRRLRLGAPACVGTLLLAACGGGGDEPASQAQAHADARAHIASAASCGNRTNNTFDKLLECVTLAGVRAHQAAFQAIADNNGGTRAAGTPGYDASVDYVRQKLIAAGYQVSLHAFPFVFVPPPTLQQIAPIAATYETGAFTGTGFGNVTAPVTAVDIVLALPRDPVSSGCQAADFAGFTPGHIALVQRGGCNFSVKALNAQAAGASAVIIFNQGNTPDREDLIVGTLAPASLTIPVVGASFANGAALAQPGSQAIVRVDPAQNITQYNVIAESTHGDPNNVVMAGAHLDSVQRGPGINDNGSGSGVVLEVALQMAKVKPRNKLRFAWWGAEESGLVGSTAYVNSLTQAQQDQIALYLNFDMVGSPNHVFFIYDGDNSDGVGAGPGPDGSAQIEKTFERFYAERGIPFKGTDFTGRSDYGRFIAVGIPAGGLFTGAEGIKTAEEAATWGGTAGQPYDPCYHLACDTFANNNDHALDVNADAVAYATLQYAMNTEDVNGQRGKGNFRKLEVPYPPPPAQ